jgi:hypothetical protein
MVISLGVRERIVDSSEGNKFCEEGLRDFDSVIDLGA